MASQSGDATWLSSPNSRSAQKRAQPTPAMGKTVRRRTLPSTVRLKFCSHLRPGEGPSSRAGTIDSATATARMAPKYTIA